MKEGFSLIELMIAVAIVGVLAVLAVYGTQKYLANAKSTEARNMLGQLAKDASTTMFGTDPPSFCGSASNQVPASVPRGEKYLSKAAEWNTGSNTAGWRCLGFSIEQPQYYAYTYAALSTNGVRGGFLAQAYGDLNGDGVTSTFTVEGSAYSGRVAISPNVQETNPEE
jgi:type IV pilus assembly protein PilA